MPFLKVFLGFHVFQKKIIVSEEAEAAAAAAQKEQKSETAADQFIITATPVVQKSSAPIPEKKRAVEPTPKQAAPIKEKSKSRESKKEPWKTSTAPAATAPVTETVTVAATQDWPTLAKAELNGHVSPSNSVS